MPTMTADAVRDLKIGDINTIPVVASDIIYGGAAVGIVRASGLARPLTSADSFAGFAQRQCDNSTGAAAAKDVTVIRSGIVTIPVAGAVITDVGAHVWATDDDTFGFTGVSGVYIGRVVRFVSSGIVDVQFDAGRMTDPFGARIHELRSANHTLDAEDSGKVIWVDTNGVVITLPAVGGISGVIVANAAAYGVSGVAVSPNAADMIEAADITAADNKDIINTQATAQRGDFVDIYDGDANGWVVVRRQGIWAREP